MIDRLLIATIWYYAAPSLDEQFTWRQAWCVCAVLLQDQHFTCKQASHVQCCSYMNIFTCKQTLLVWSVAFFILHCMIERHCEDTDHIVVVFLYVCDIYLTNM